MIGIKSDIHSVPRAGSQSKFLCHHNITVLEAELIAEAAHVVFDMSGGGILEIFNLCGDQLEALCNLLLCRIHRDSQDFFESPWNAENYLAHAER